MEAATCWGWGEESELAGAWGAVYECECADEIWERPRQRRPQRFSRHARKRAARRNVECDAVEYVLAYGRIIQRTGVTFYFLARRDIPRDDRATAWATRLEGTIVLVALDGAVITVYRNRRALRTIKRKLKYRLPELDRRLTAVTTALAMMDADRAIA